MLLTCHGTISPKVYFGHAPEKTLQATLQAKGEILLCVFVYSVMPSNVFYERYRIRELFCVPL